MRKRYLRYIIDKQTFKYRIIELALPSSALWIALNEGEDYCFLKAILIFMGITTISLFRWKIILKLDKDNRL